MKPERPLTTIFFTAIVIILMIIIALLVLAVMTGSPAEASIACPPGALCHKVYMGWLPIVYKPYTLIIR